MSISYLFYGDSRRVAATRYFYYNEMKLQYKCLNSLQILLINLSTVFVNTVHSCLFFSPHKENCREPHVRALFAMLPQKTCQVCLYPAFMKMNRSSPVVQDWPKNEKIYIFYYVYGRPHYNKNVTSASDKTIVLSDLKS